MEIKITDYIEIPITIIGNYIPAEKPDFSEMSSCPGHREDAEIISIQIAGVSLTGRAQDEFIREHDPNLIDRVIQAIIIRGRKKNII
jgi:hypothetical protein